MEFVYDAAPPAQEFKVPTTILTPDYPDLTVQNDTYRRFGPVDDFTIPAP